MCVYVWCEDSGSGFTFWKELFQTLYPEFIVESKGNNSRLSQAAGAITDDGNRYYILMDTALDNPDVLREITRLKRNIAGKYNVFFVEIHSFEYVLLSFRLLEQWVFAEEDDLKQERKALLQARTIFTELVMQKEAVGRQSELRELFPYVKNHNEEQISAELLFQITRNTGFETVKGKLGPCFINSCCEWTSRQENDLCGLDKTRLTANEKKKILWEKSMLKDAFMKVGL